MARKKKKNQMVPLKVFQGGSWRHGMNESDLDALREKYSWPKNLLMSITRPEDCTLKTKGGDEPI